MKKIVGLFYLLPFVIFCVALSGCKKFVSIPAPEDKLVNTSVFQDDATATATVLGIYEKMMESIAYFSNGGVTFYTGLAADELVPTPTNSVYNEFYYNQISPANTSLKTALWGSAYQTLYQCNSVLTGVSNSPISVSVKNQLMGEVTFMRAFYQFYLVNLFGDIPLVTQPDYTLNRVAFRMPIDKVYSQILKDLQDAVKLLPDNYVDKNNQMTTTEKVRPNKGAANALMARVYLYMKDWKDAEATAGLLISQTDRYSLDSDLNQVFLAGSDEAIWQLMPVVPNQNAAEGYMFVLTSAIPVYASLDSGLRKGFQPEDQRAKNWIGCYVNAGDSVYYPAKYKVKVSTSLREYNNVLRLAEQYLIRSEARNEEDNVSGAADDLNKIRQRAGLDITEANDYESMKLAIESERRHELFCEWGHRWLDLKRTGRIDAILSERKSSWEPTDSLFPIPQIEIQNDANLTQNPGY